MKKYGLKIGILIVVLIALCFGVYEVKRPKTYQDFYNLSCEQIDEGNYDKALEYLMKAKELDSSRMDVYVKILLVYSIQGEESKIEGVLKEVDDKFTDDEYDLCIIEVRDLSKEANVEKDYLPQTKEEIRKEEEEKKRQEEEERKRKEEEECKKKEEEERKKKEEEERIRQEEEQRRLEEEAAAQQYQQPIDQTPACIATPDWVPGSTEPPCQNYHAIWHCQMHPEDCY